MPAKKNINIRKFPHHTVGMTTITINPEKARLAALLRSSTGIAGSLTNNSINSIVALFEEALPSAMSKKRHSGFSYSDGEKVYIAMSLSGSFKKMLMQGWADVQYPVTFKNTLEELNEGLAIYGAKIHAVPINFGIKAVRKQISSVLNKAGIKHPTGFYIDGDKYKFIFDFYTKIGGLHTNNLNLSSHLFRILFYQNNITKEEIYQAITLRGARISDQAAPERSINR
ncbi:MAG: hypothetical protein M1158_00200 [Candidatus Marsarchaeota archaeon]|nr:hypothetical protein [Candidatus Marsarchaeota archaeon]